MSDPPSGRANQRAGLRKAESLRKVYQIAMAAIRSSAEGMASTGIGRGWPVGSTRFQKVALRGKTFNSWRKLRNELGFQTYDRLPCAERVCVRTKHRRYVANQDMLWENDSRPKTNNGVPTEDGVASLSTSGIANRLAMFIAATTKAYYFRQLARHPLSSLS